MQSLFLLNVETLIGALFWCNLSAFGFLLLYCQTRKQEGGHQNIRYLLAAKLLHGFAYLCFYYRGILPDWLSVNVGNTVFLVGFYFEARALLIIVRQYGKRLTRLLRGILIISVLLFNLSELIANSGGVRVATASVGVVLIMAVPNVKIIVARNTSAFAKSTALLYTIFLMLLLPRAVHSLQNQDVGILTHTVVQSLTFETLLLLAVFSIPSYILIIKEYTDETLLLMATTDRVTGAVNRYAFMEVAYAVFDNHKRFGLPLCVLFIDIDHFKSVNDRYGHAFGDKVLVRLTGIIDHCLRSSDLSCRYGGEEFVVLLTKSKGDTVGLVAERIMREAKAAYFDEDKDFRFTVSIGACCATPGSGAVLEDYIQSADEAMYQAKKAGRDRFVVKQS